MRLARSYLGLFAPQSPEHIQPTVQDSCGPAPPLRFGKCSQERQGGGTGDLRESLVFQPLPGSCLFCPEAPAATATTTA